jgi:hypothetical protein
MELHRLGYKLLNRIFATGLLIAVTVPHDCRNCYKLAENLLNQQTNSSQLVKIIMRKQAEFMSSPWEDDLVIFEKYSTYPGAGSS